MARLRYSILKVLGGNALFAASQWALVIAIARLAGAEALGFYALANALVSPVFAFAGMGLRPSLATDVRREHASGEYLRIYVVATLVAFVVGLGVLAIYGVGAVALVIGIALAFARAAENGSQLSYGLFQYADKMGLVARSLALRGLLGLALPIAILAVARDAIGLAVAGMAAAWVLILLVSDVLSARPLAAERDAAPSEPGTTRTPPALLRVVAPLGALALVTSLTLQVPRLAVEEYLGARELGYFAGIVQIAVVGSIVVNAIGQAVVPSLARQFRNGAGGYLRLLAKTLALTSLIGVLGVVGAMLLGDPFLRFVYSDAFGGQGDALVAAMVWSMVLYISVTLGCGMSAMRSFASQLGIGCVTLVATVAAALVLVPDYGLVGAALALTVGNSGESHDADCDYCPPCWPAARARIARVRSTRSAPNDRARPATCAAHVAHEARPGGVRAQYRCPCGRRRSHYRHG